MPGEPDRVSVAVFDDAVFGGAEEAGEPVAHGDARRGCEKLRELHGSFILDEGWIVVLANLSQNAYISN
ncbi:MAG: hypothetical protein A3F75_03845 [Betaproteobacteria bacterium RIFCSPLOWO2_12_FULL_64_23]|nr:MAG: hypothetical protein A3F75_03845 [Betaproteobacteria bacterium RIFCSPLOWO2_12_FULL_64_23]